MMLITYMMITEMVLITSKRERVSAEAILQTLEEPRGTIQAIDILFWFEINEIRTSTQFAPVINSSLRPDLLTTDFKVCRPLVSYPTRYDIFHHPSNREI